MASVHYRRQINYSTENLEQAAKILERFKNTLNNLDFRLNDQIASKISNAVRKALIQTKEKFIAAMDDDFNVQNALTAIYDLLPIVNANLNDENVDKEALTDFKQSLTGWLEIFGIDVTKLIANNTGQDDQEIEALVQARDEARKAKDWAKSDQIRDELKAMGVIIQDTPQGTRWTRE